MRPKKRIVLVDANEERMGILSFVLTQHGYFVIRATPGREAERATRIWDANAVVRRGEKDEFLLESPRNVRRMELPGPAPMSVLLEGLKSVAHTKCGPPKGHHYTIVDGKRQRVCSDVMAPGAELEKAAVA